MSSKRVCRIDLRVVRTVAVLLAGLWLCGCGPSQEQQLERARKALELHSRGIALLENKQWLEADAALEELTALLPEALVPARNLAVGRLLALTDRESPYNESKDAVRFLAALQKAEATMARYRALAARSTADEQSIAAMLAGKLLVFQDSPERPTVAGGMQLLQEAVRLSGDRPEMWYALALAMDGHRDYADSAELIEVLQKTASLAPENLAVVTRLLDKQGLAATSADPQVRSAAATLPQTVRRAAELLVPLNESIKKQNRVDIVDVLNKALAAAKPGEPAGLMGPAIMARNLLSPELAQQIDMRRINLNLLEYVQLELRPELGLSAESLRLLRGVQQPTVLQAFVPGAAMPTGSVSGRFQLVDMDLNGVDDLVWLENGRLRVSTTSGAGGEGWTDVCGGPEGFIADGFLLADLDRDFDRAKLADVKSAAVLLDPEGDRRTVPQLAGENRWYDADHDVVLWNAAGVQLLRNERGGDGVRSLVPVPGLPAVAGVRTACVADLEADGDLDIVLGTAEGAVIWRNLDGTEFELATSGIAGPTGGVRDVVAVDWNRDLAMDVVAVLDDGTVGVLENLLHSRFRWVPLEGVNAGADCADVVVGEFNRDGFWDLATAAGGLLRVWLSAGRGRLSEAVPVLQLDGRFTRLTTGDLDNDGVTDLVAGHTTQTQLLRGASDGTFSQLTSLLPAGMSSASVELADLDQDGDLDLVSAAAGAAGGAAGLQSIRNEGGNQNNWIEIVPRAIGEDSQFPSNRVNMHAAGAVLEVRAGTNWQAMVIDQPRLHIGLGSAKQADAARVIWTDGVPQNLTDLRFLRARLAVLAPQILLGSCPYIYTWNGERFEFFSDCLWAAPLGLVQASGEMAPIREWEYLLIPGRSLRPRDGRYVLQLTEELWEAAYFDEVQLVAVDHPADVQVFTNEKVGGPDIAAHRIHTVQRPRLPVSVVDGHGRDLLPGLQQQDQRYVQAFERRIVQGLTDEWTMEFDLGELGGELPLREPRLVLTGWVFPTDTSINEAIRQNAGLPEPAPPVLEIPDGAGGWRVVRPFIGFPSGKTKAMVVDLEGVISGENSRLRLRSSMELYWDAAFFMVNEPEVTPVLQACALRSANLHYRGFSQRVYGPESLFRGGAGPEGYDYERVVQEPRWSEMAGRFTRYGDVTELLQRQDDCMIVMGPGDEVTVEFDVPQAEPPAGWVRDFVLYNVGWDKDANLNTVYGQTSEPYPTRGMQRYPGDPSRVEPLSEGQQRWLDEYQVREYEPYRFRDVLRRGGAVTGGSPEKR